jgi:hypothetical protein
MLILVKLLPGRMLIISALLALLPACVSRYDRVDDVYPLSDECKDYSAFSRALAKQRDNGFTKRATMSMAGYSVANAEDRKVLYERYQTVADILFEDLLIDPDSAKVIGKVICEQKQQHTWQPIKSNDIPEVAAMVRSCRKVNITLVEMETCIVDRLNNYWRPDLATPPMLDEN